MWLAYKLQMGYVLTMFYIYYEKTFLFFFFPSLKQASSWWLVS